MVGISQRIRKTAKTDYLEEILNSPIFKRSSDPWYPFWNFAWWFLEEVRLPMSNEILYDVGVNYELLGP